MLEGNKRRKRKITGRRINVKCRQGGADPASVSHTQDMGTCTIFPQCTSLLLFKLVHASCSVSSIKRSKQGSRLVSANLVAPALLAKTVACDGAREVRSCLWPDAACVEVAAGSHTTTLPHYHTSTLPRSPKVGTSTSVSSRFWAASSDIGGGSSKVLQAGDLADGIWSSCFPPRSRSFRSL